MFDKLSQQNVRIIQGFVSLGESTLSPGESTLGPGESTFSSGESTQKSGEWAIGRNNCNSFHFLLDSLDFTALFSAIFFSFL